MSRYLVTGGLGVIGSLFARQVLAQGHDVTIIDPGEESRNEWIWRTTLDPEFGVGVDEIYRLRLERWRFDGSKGIPLPPLRDVLASADYVLHAGASTGIPYSGENPTDDWERNVDGTRALLEALRKCPRPTVVLSSVKPYRVPKLYQDSFDPLWRDAESSNVWDGLTENDLLEPDEPYAASKAAQSLMCQAYARSYNLPITVFRCSNLAGPGPCHGPRHGWLTWFCISAAIGRPLIVQGTGEQSRDILFAPDVGSAVLAAFKRMEDFTPAALRGEIFNLGGGRENLISVRQAANILHELTGAEIKSGPARAMDDDCVFVDYSKLRNATGWTPQVSVVDGIRSTLAWAQAHAGDLRKLYEGV